MDHTTLTLVIGKLKARIQSIRKSGLQMKPRFEISKLTHTTTAKGVFYFTEDEILGFSSLENEWGRLRRTFTTTAQVEFLFKRREFKPELAVRERELSIRLRRSDPSNKDFNV